MMFALLTLVATCGPDFPEHLLEDRSRTMTELVAGSFRLDAMTLMKPELGYAVVEGNEAKDAREHGSDRERELYDDGARAWKQGDTVAAERSWRKLLALPKAERMNRSTWAAFMLGKATQDPKWFTLTRKLARAGFDDDLGLASASLGDEARIDLGERKDVEAVRLYAEQAALGSTSGYASLLFVARALVNDEARLARSIHDPIVQRLVATYLFTRGVDELDPTSSTKLLRALGDRRDVAGADRLAVAAYRAGQYDLAAKFAARSSPTGLASWVKAKLALRNGDETSAERELASASSQFTREEWWSQSGTMLGDDVLAPKTRIDAERAILAMKNGKYDDALTLFLESGQTYWLDAAQVAERAMTVDELVQYVDAHDAHPIAADAKRDQWDIDVRARLRSLLARRLMREHRASEAERYFDDVELRELAKQFDDDALRVLFARHDAIARAQGRFDLAKLTRRRGLALVGTELAPDWAVFDGNYDLSEYATDGAAAHAATSFVGVDEAARAAKSAPVPNERFHYRASAAMLADAAAYDLPPRSQAFAAVLCTASSWLVDREPDEAARYWLRYVREGAPVDFASTFGRSCPAPDFAAARTPAAGKPKSHLRHAKPLHKRTAARDAALMLGLVALTSLAARTISRRRTSMPIASPPP